ncbi:hypothetical protein OKW38_007108 [Paraburkholderia sp. MM5496-R1]|uniref:hypothetical protein n=1 Tax=Paraburkholderia TaxID=1822464 RepID=UPI0011600389|nr:MULTISPECIES: hypothetical protein [Paraburkholderia]
MNEDKKIRAISGATGTECFTMFTRQRIDPGKKFPDAVDPPCNEARFAVSMGAQTISISTLDSYISPWHAGDMRPADGTRALSV